MVEYSFLQEVANSPYEQAGILMRSYIDRGMSPEDAAKKVFDELGSYGKFSDYRVGGGAHTKVKDALHDAVTQRTEVAKKKLGSTFLSAHEATKTAGNKADALIQQTIEKYNKLFNLTPEEWLAKGPKIEQVKKQLDNTLNELASQSQKLSKETLQKLAELRKNAEKSYLRLSKRPNIGGQNVTGIMAKSYESTMSSLDKIAKNTMPRNLSKIINPRLFSARDAANIRGQIGAGISGMRPSTTSKIIKHIGKLFTRG